MAISAAMLIGLGFRPLQAATLALIGNTAPVAFGSLGIPIISLAQVTGLPLLDLSAMVGRQLPFFSLLIPFWLVAALAGWRGMLGVWPACLVTGLSFALTQFAVSNYHGPWLVDTASSLVSMGALLLLLRFWRPATTWPLRRRDRQHRRGAGRAAGGPRLPRLVALADPHRHRFSLGAPRDQGAPGRTPGSKNPRAPSAPSRA